MNIYKSNSTLRKVPQFCALKNLPYCAFGSRRRSSNNGQKPHPGPKQNNLKYNYAELLEKKRDSLNRSLAPYYSEPLLVSSASMQWIFDHNQKRYLDFFGGIVTVSVGHCHPRLVEVLRKQSEILWHTTQIYTQPQIVSYSQKLTSKLPDPLNVAYLVNSGSEAVDLALTMARLSTKHNEILALRNCYHGMSASCMSLTSVPRWNHNIPNRRNNVMHLGMVVDPYRGVYGGKNCRDSLSQVKGRDCDCQQGKCKASEMYVNEMKQTMEFMMGSEMAGFIAEGIQGVGGTVQFPKGFLKEAYKLTREYGGICIADEVQTGFGRLGSHFWGFESHEVLPDIVVMAKGIGNGFPMAAVVTTPVVAASLSKALFFNTYGGNPLACVVGEEVLNIIEEDKLQNNSHVVGSFLIEELKKIREEFEIVGDVRGKGLMIGVEMVESKESRKPLQKEKFLKIFEEMKNHGLLVGKGGPYDSVFRIKPPMCISLEDASFALSVFRKVLKNNQ